MSHKRNTFPTESVWLLEQGVNVTSRNTDGGVWDEEMRDVLETLHSPKCVDELCHPSCDFTLLIAHYYEGLSVSEIAKRYGFRNKGSAWYRIDKARGRLKAAFINQIGDPFE